MLRREGGRVAPASRRWCGGWSTPCGCPCCCRRRSLARGGASATMAAVWPKNGPSWHPGQRRAQGGGPSADAFRLLSNSAFQPPSWRPTAEIMEMCSSPATRASWCKPFRSSIRERWSGLGLARRNTSHRAAGSRDSRDSRQIAASSGAARRPSAAVTGASEVVRSAVSRRATASLVVGLSEVVRGWVVTSVATSAVWGDSDVVR